MSTDPQSILIVRLSAIGDVIFSTSLLPGLRQRYPHARIVWLAESLGAEVLGDHPLLDAVWVLPRRRWVKEWKAGRKGAVLREVLEWRKKLRAERFDLAIDMQGLLKSGICAWLSGAPRRVSLEGREGSRWLMHETVHDPESQGGRICRDYFVLSQYLGLPEEVFGMSLHPDPKMVEGARQKIAAADPERLPVFLFPFTTRPQKHWFDERWAELANIIHRRGGYSVWILGGPGDTAQAESITAQANVPIHLVVGPQTDLQEKLALVSQAHACVGVDTGLTHMSYGLHRPTVALFGSTCPYLNTNPVPGVVLYDDLECAPCHRHPTCNGRFTCMRNHSAERVYAALEPLLARR